MPYKLENFSNCIHMYVMYGCEQVSGKTCHLVYIELGLNFQMLFQKVAESEVSD